MNRIEAHPSVVCTVLDDGGVLLHLETKYYYSVNRTGLALWLHLESGFVDLPGALAARFPDAPGRAAALDDFLARLVAERLVVAAAPVTAAVSAGGSGTTAAAGGAEPPLSLAPDAQWEAPRLTRHDTPLNQILSNPFDPCVPLAE